MQSIFEQPKRILVIAEFGVNHNGALERARAAINAVADAGADAIKFQTYIADELVVKGTPKFWKSEGGDIGEDQYEAYKALGGFPYEYYPELMQLCEERGIEFLSTPFSIDAAERLNEMGMKAFKIASSDMSTLPFLKYIASFNKPILLSTGASTLNEIKEAVKTIEDEGNTKITLLHCTLAYPTKPVDANLNIIAELKKLYPQYTIGISDHTLGILPSIVAGAMGAQVIEKHFTLDKTLPDSADHWLSIDPEELKQLVNCVRWTEVLRGQSVKKVFDCEAETRVLDKRSWVSKVFIPKDTILTEEMLTWKRPGTGIWPSENIIGRKTLIDYQPDTTITWDGLSKETTN